MRDGDLRARQGRLGRSPRHVPHTATAVGNTNVVTVAYDVTVSLQEQARKDAERVLDTWGRRFPVDPVRIARGLGINVVDVPLGGDVAGALVKEAGTDPLIMLNETDNANRKRFTTAHELGHFVRHTDEEYEYIDRRDTLSSLGQDPEEIYANAFAANLLMPEKDVKRLHGDDVTDYEMALRFGVSREAMRFRLVNLGLKTQ